MRLIRPRIEMRGRRHQGSTAALSIVGIMALVALTACGSGGSKASASGSGSGSSSEGPITVGTGFYADSLNPALGESGGDYFELNMLYDTLLKINPTTGALEPDLATAFQFEGPKDLEYALTLRQGVTFQDGTAFNADAVKTSLEYFIHNDAIGQLVPSQVASIDVTGTYSLVIHLTQPLASLPFLLADRAGMIISPAALAKYGSKGLSTHPVGAGPFSFASEVPETSVTLKKYPKYWDASSIHLSGVTFEYYASSITEFDAIKSGTIQIAADLPGSDEKPSQADHSLKVETGTDTGFDDIFFNLGMTPFNNLDVRLAFNEALNRNAITNLTTSGLGHPGWGPYAPGYPYFDSAAVNAWPYNPAKAKKLLAAGGHPNGLNLTCYDYPGAEYETAAPVILQDEAAIGIHINLITETLSEAATAFNIDGKAPCLFADWGSSFDAQTTLSELFGSDSYYNGGAEQKGKINYGVDSEINALSSAFTLSELKQGIDNTLAGVAKTASWAPLFFLPNFDVTASNVSGDAAEMLLNSDYESVSLTKG